MQMKVYTTPRNDYTAAFLDTSTTNGNTKREMSHKQKNKIDRISSQMMITYPMKLQNNRVTLFSTYSAVGDSHSKCGAFILTKWPSFDLLLLLVRFFMSFLQWKSIGSKDHNLVIIFSQSAFSC